MSIAAWLAVASVVCFLLVLVMGVRLAIDIRCFACRSPFNTGEVGLMFLAIVVGSGCTVARALVGAL